MKTQDEKHIDKTGFNSVDAWKMIYHLMDNTKVAMDNDYKTKNGNISNEDVDNIINYIHEGLRNTYICLSTNTQTPYVYKVTSENPSDNENNINDKK